MEEREFRIYVSDCGDVPVVRDIVGEEQKEQRLAEVRNCYPGSVVSVHEVFESTIEVYKPGSAPVSSPEIGADF